MLLKCSIWLNVRLNLVRNHDVAPTSAELLGLHLPDVEGQVLKEALNR